MGCSTKKFRIERLPSSTIPLSFWSRMPFPSVFLLGTHTRALGGPDRRLLGVGGVGGGSAHTHDARKPARLREGVQHQDQEDRERRSQERPGPAQQPRPEDEPQEEDRRRD